MSDKTLGAYERHESPDDMDGGVTAALIEKEADGRMLGLEFRARSLSDDRDYWKGRAEKAEKERDEARATKDMHKRRADEERARADAIENDLTGALDTSDTRAVLIKAQQDTIDRLRTQPRPLTPDAITDEMVERALAAHDQHPAAATNSTIMREALAAALAEPQRPDGAEELETVIGLNAGKWTSGAEDVRALADLLASHGVRVVTGEQL